MSLNITYMGTKHELAPSVIEVIGLARPGPVLDAFAGMCSVGTAVGTTRQVWVNDIQRFASEVGYLLFSSKDLPINTSDTADILFGRFLEHANTLQSTVIESVEAERSKLEYLKFEEFSKANQVVNYIFNEQKELLKNNQYYLFTYTYGNAYFGIQQSIEIDSLVFSINKAVEDECISNEQKRWLIVALGWTLLRISNTTGHFAQYLKPKEGSYRVYQRQRKRGVWDEFLNAVGRLEPVGPQLWRNQNRSFNQDSICLIESFDKNDQGPGVVYADPPYTSDHYSRYYHVLETLVQYDYPNTQGAGLYRTDRYRTAFSLKSLASNAFERLIKGSAKCGADLVLSYPTNGLIPFTHEEIISLMRSVYPYVERTHAISFEHSTLGASKGTAKASVVEQIFLGRLT